LSAESEGAASLGAGALELPTNILRQIRVPDVRRLSDREAEELIALAKEVWGNERPTDWRANDRPGGGTRILDEWLLARMAVGVGTERLHESIVEACRARLALAQDKQTKTKKAIQHDIESVAETIAASVRPLLEGKQFPEAFSPAGSELTTFDFSGFSVLAVRVEP